MHIEINAVAQIITSIGGAVSVVLLALAKFLPVWWGRKRKSALPTSSSPDLPASGSGSDA